MERKRETHGQFVIPFAGLKVGKHEFQFDVTGSFFEQPVEEEAAENPVSTQEADIQVTAELTKQVNMMVLHLNLSGWIEVPCDRCLNWMQQSLEDQRRLVFKFGEEAAEETEELVILPQTEHQLDIAQYIFEFVFLALPYRKVHDESACDPEVMKRLSIEEEPKPAEVDPRWSALQGLKNQEEN